MPKLEIVANTLLMQGESGEVNVTLDRVKVEAILTCSNKLGVIKNNLFLAKGAGVCEITAKYKDYEDKKSITVMAKNEVIGSKPSKVKSALIDTSMFAVLNPDMFILLLIVLGCIVCSTVVTLIFVRDVTFVKVATGLVSSIVVFLLAVAKTIMPKGQVAKGLEVKYFPKGGSLLKNTTEYLLNKKG